MQREIKALSPQVKEYFARGGNVTWFNVEGHPRYDKQLTTISNHINILGKDILDVATGIYGLEKTSISILTCLFLPNMKLQGD